MFNSTLFFLGWRCDEAWSNISQFLCGRLLARRFRTVCLTQKPYRPWPAGACHIWSCLGKVHGPIVQTSAVTTWPRSKALRQTHNIMGIKFQGREDMIFWASHPMRVPMVPNHPSLCIFAPYLLTNSQPSTYLQRRGRGVRCRPSPAEGRPTVERAASPMSHVSWGTPQTG